jgi:hypothetical protein
MLKCQIKVAQNRFLDDILVTNPGSKLCDNGPEKV